GQAISNNILQGNIDVGFSLALGTVMGTYRAIDTGKARVDAMAGLRVSSVELSVGAALSSGTASRSARAKSTWVDPAIGVKFGYDYSENLSLTGWGIVGGFGAGSDLFWDVFGGAEYYFNDQLSALVGFRGGGTDYKSSNLVYDVTNWGPMLGLGLKLGPTASRSEDAVGLSTSQEPDVNDWSGAYVGVGLGYYGGVDQVTAMPYSLFTGRPRPVSNRVFTARARGFVGGGFIGYNFHVPDSPFVLGVEGDISGIAAKDSVRSTVRLGRVTSMQAKGKNNFAWTLRGRLGYATGAFMPYITGGYAGLSAKTSLTLTQATGSSTQSKTNTYSGWTFGGGLDFMMSPSMILGAEFRHANYGAKTNNFTYPGTGLLPTGTGASVRTKIFDNQILVRGAYRF
ncbi:MAG: outer membrane protein, partial [Hyphomicrobiales bacterium]